MRIHSARAAGTAAIVLAAAVGAVAAPAQAGAQDWRLHRGGSAVKAAADCTIAPASVNLYTEPRDITFDVPWATQQWLIDGDLVGAADPTFRFEDGFEVTPTWTFDPTEYDNAEAGTEQVDVFTGADLPDVDTPFDQCQAPFSLKRGAKISATLTVGGGYRTLAGKVQSASWGEKPKYVSVRSGIVDVQKFLGGEWVTKKTLTTNSSGEYSARIKAAAGDWRAVFRGTSKIGSRTSATSTG